MAVAAALAACCTLFGSPDGGGGGGGVCVSQASKCKIQKFNIPNLVFQLDAIRFVNHVILCAS